LGLRRKLKPSPSKQPRHGLTHVLGRRSGLTLLAPRSGYISQQVDVNHQSQRIDIVVDPSIDVGDRYSPATSSCPTTAIPQCMVLRSLCFVKRQAAKKWAFLSQLSEFS